jgi:hypothetical protein
MGLRHVTLGRVSRAALTASFCLLLATGARAFEPTAEQREACTGDAFRLCSSAIPDVARITACMAANKASLSPRCRVVFDAGVSSTTRVAHSHRTKHEHRHHLARS